VTIEGANGSFCEGLNLEMLVPGDSKKDDSEVAASLARYADLLETLVRMSIPVIALVDGPALGGGVGIVAAADLVLASSRASFALPETLMGLIPAMAFPYLAQRIGVPRARLLALGGKPLSAADALQWGLVDRLSNDLETALIPHIRRFSCMDPHAIGTIKSLIADHFAKSARYRTDASLQFHDCLSRQETRQRLARFLVGESPWPEDATYD
jgi:enoyl-CoA hydratase/carnithine racemase